jgi:prepilin-type N-terminal cleavage/methylation domain-containing protein
MKTGQGFSLIEIAIVLVVLGFLIGSLLHPLAKKVEQDKIKLTQHNLEEIKQALLGYAVLHGCLPCPAIDAAAGEVRDKVDIDICSQPCKYSAVQEGFIPWLDLGVGRYDAWGNRFRYRLKKEYTDDRLAPHITTSFKVVRNLQEETEENFLTEENPLTKDESPVVAIIYSYGPNGASEQPGKDQTYIQDGYLENKFDDILTWLSKNTVNDYLIAAGKKNYALTTAQENSEFTNSLMKHY